LTCWSHDSRNRELRAVDLLEISIIHSWPAYPSTEVHARSRAGLVAHSRAVLRRVLVGVI